MSLIRRLLGLMVAAFTGDSARPILHETVLGQNSENLSLYDSQDDKATI